jgi:hypothetical protein
MVSEEAAFLMLLAVDSAREMDFELDLFRCASGRGPANRFRT